MRFSLEDVPVRFYRRIKVSKATGCWLWMETVSDRGYALSNWQGKKRLVHRVIYQLQVETIPEGLELDHTCQATNCVYPAHLEPVMGQVNRTRAVFYGVAPPPPRELLLSDILDVMSGDQAPLIDVCGELVLTWPDRYRHWTARQLGSALMAVGVTERKQIWIYGPDGRRTNNRTGVSRAEIMTHNREESA